MDKLAAVIGSYKHVADANKAFEQLRAQYRQQFERVTPDSSTNRDTPA